ncbi:hypothetical protein [Geodermatophilus sp. URMC 63]
METQLRIRGMRAEGSDIASGESFTSWITAGSRPSRSAWQEQGS